MNESLVARLETLYEEREQINREISGHETSIRIYKDQLGPIVSKIRELTTKQTDYSNLKKQFQNTLKYFQENFDLIDKNNELKFKLEDKEFNEFQILEDEFKKYKRFKNIKRFSIPIIGMISCGKSSLLNFLLGMNCLEKGDDITTKSVVIIRHNKNLKNDERYIYSVIINERSED